MVYHSVLPQLFSENVRLQGMQTLSAKEQIVLTGSAVQAMGTYIPTRAYTYKP